MGLLSSTIGKNIFGNAKTYGRSFPRLGNWAFQMNGVRTHLGQINIKLTELLKKSHNMVNSNKIRKYIEENNKIMKMARDLTTKSKNVSADTIKQSNALLHSQKMKGENLLKTLTPFHGGTESSIKIYTILLTIIITIIIVIIVYVFVIRNKNTFISNYNIGTTSSYTSGNG
jgi:uncharacterized integral membrane protein